MPAGVAGQQGASLSVGGAVPRGKASGPRRQIAGVRVNARDLHTFLESGQEFTHWVTNRAKSCQLVKDEDYGVCFGNFGSKECGVRAGRGGHNAKEYWLTLDAAKEFSMLERNDHPWCNG